MRLALTLMVASLAPAQTLSLDARNPHYFSYRGKPAVLITTAEHYGSALNLKFDYLRYLDELQRNGFNLTRTFTGTYREDGTSGHGPSPLSPGRGEAEFSTPWAWSDVKGGPEGRKFDLDRWNPAYFRRLKDFLRAAEERGVIVELVLFCRMYSDQLWRSSPLHPENSIAGDAWRGVKHTEFLTSANQALLARQKAVTRKIVTELRDVPNVYFELANEPSPERLDSDAARALHTWHEAIAAEIVDAESGLPAGKRHLIAWNFHHAPGQGIGPIPKHVNVLNFHYLPRLAEALAEYGQNKPIGFDETRWIAHPRYPQYRNTMTVDAGRVEAWEFFAGGGAVYSNLNHAYQVEDPAGQRPESQAFKQQLAVLKRFLEQVDFVRMRQDRTVVASGAANWRAISEAGRRYAIYLHHSSIADGRRSYLPSERATTVDLVLDLPAGQYRIEWIQPSTGRVLRTDQAPHTGGKLTLKRSPEHTADLALRIQGMR